MVSSQFLKLLNFYKDNNVTLSRYDITVLCLFNEEFIEAIFEILEESAIQNQAAILKVIKNKEIMLYDKFLDLLEIVADINPDYITELLEILKLKDMTRIPKFFSYMELYHRVTTYPEHVFTFEFKEKISEDLPDALKIYDEHSGLDNVCKNIKQAIINSIVESYQYFIEDSEEIFFEDDDNSKFAADIESNFFLGVPKLQHSAKKIIRSIKPDHIPKRHRVIKIDFKKEEE